jgi:hypothetical protein
MAVTLDQLEQFLVARNLKYRREKDRVVTGFRSTHFRDDRGQAGIAIAVRVDEDGRYVEFIAPGLYCSRGCRQTAALFQTLLEITMRTKMIRFELDPTDGMVRCTVEVPVEDGTLTAKQFDRILDGLRNAIDRWHPVIRRAMDTGVVNLDMPRPIVAAVPG